MAKRLSISVEAALVVLHQAIKDDWTWDPSTPVRTAIAELNTHAARKKSRLPWPIPKDADR